jgi:hypothetical protein
VAVSFRRRVVRGEVETATRAAPPEETEETEMTEYMLTVHSSAADYARDPADFQAEFEAVDRFNQKARDAGIWVFAGGLEAPDTATVVDGRGAEAVLTDGPYLDTKEWIGGFWVFNLPDLDSALQWAKEASAACAGKVEVRPFQAEPA